MNLVLVNIKGIGAVNFPAGTSQKQIKAILEKSFAKKQDDKLFSLREVELLVKGFINKAVLFVSYEALAAHPKQQLANIYNHINEAPYEHDFDNVENTAIDPDYMYLNKFPHQGTGKVEDKTDWQAFVPQQLAGEIMQTHSAYNQTFGYV